MSGEIDIEAIRHPVGGLQFKAARVHPVKFGRHRTGDRVAGDVPKLRLIKVPTNCERVASSEDVRASVCGTEFECMGFLGHSDPPLRSGAGAQIVDDRKTFSIGRAAEDRQAVAKIVGQRQTAHQCVFFIGVGNTCEGILTFNSGFFIPQGRCDRELPDRHFVHDEQCKAVIRATRRTCCRVVGTNATLRLDAREHVVRHRAGVEQCTVGHGQLGGLVTLIGVHGAHEERKAGRTFQRR